MNNISQLIDKYFRGETTLEEESQIKTFFQQADIPQHLKVYQPLFSLLDEEKEKQLSQKFDQEIYNKIKPTQKKTFRLNTIHRWSSAVAASLVLVLSIWWLYPNVEQEASSAINWEQYEPEDPQEAYRITRDALMKVSMGLNRGAEKAAKEVGFLKSILKE